VSQKGPGKRIIAALGFGYFVNSAQELSISLNYPTISRSFSPALPLSGLAIINGWRIIIQTLITPLWGMAADRFSRKKVLVAGVGLWGGLAFLCGLAASYGQLFAAWERWCPRASGCSRTFTGRSSAGARSEF